MGAFEEAVEQLFQLSSADRGRLPSRLDAVARADRERWSKMSAIDMIVNFNGNPEAYFEDTSVQNHTEGNKKASILTLQAMFRYQSFAEIANSFPEAGDSFIPAYRNIKICWWARDEGPEEYRGGTPSTSTTSMWQRRGGMRSWRRPDQTIIESPDD